jgi:hypothetical protein
MKKIIACREEKSYQFRSERLRTFIDEVRPICSDNLQWFENAELVEHLKNQYPEFKVAIEWFPKEPKEMPLLLDRNEILLTKFETMKRLYPDFQAFLAAIEAEENDQQSNAVKECFEAMNEDSVREILYWMADDNLIVADFVETTTQYGKLKFYFPGSVDIVLAVLCLLSCEKAISVLKGMTTERCLNLEFLKKSYIARHFSNRCKDL